MNRNTLSEMEVPRLEQQNKKVRKVDPICMSVILFMNEPALSANRPSTEFYNRLFRLYIATNRGELDTFTINKYPVIMKNIRTTNKYLIILIS